ncbi:hypothetical protein Taro_043520 [Colocasia esculenta]|uniref:Uncharacterized protein n=1 Tax=Colocasia esculenta TaxID=4460 RepID=A0A843WGN5_COLES|nr:hypothetical protein [Colocasia esculenta]
MTSLSVRPSVYRQVLQAQQADSELADILQMPDVELDEDSERSLSQQVSGRDAPGRRVLVATGVGVAFLSHRAYSVDATCQAVAFGLLGLRGGVVPFVQGTCSWCLERGGGGHSYVEAPTGRLYLWSMLPFPCGIFVPCFGVVSERTAPEPPSAEDATATEAAMMSRPAWPPQHHRDALGRHDKVATAWATAIVSRQDETSQQRQGARRAEETGR